MKQVNREVSWNKYFSLGRIVLLFQISLVDFGTFIMALEVVGAILFKEGTGKAEENRFVSEVRSRERKQTFSSPLK